MTLEIRLAKYEEMKYKWSEMYKIIRDYVITPHLAELISDSNRVHRVLELKSESGGVSALELLTERRVKTGFWNWFVRLLSPEETVVRLENNGQIFLCQYYRHTYYSFAEKMREEYNLKLKEALGWDFVVVNKAG